MDWRGCQIVPIVTIEPLDNLGGPQFQSSPYDVKGGGIGSCLGRKELQECVFSNVQE